MKQRRIAWTVLIVLLVLHLIVIPAAIFTFSWPGVIAMFAMMVLTGMFGVCIGYHRLLTHGGFDSSPWIKRGFAFLGCLSGEGSPLFWVATHFWHHQCSDEEDDPHSPLHPQSPFNGFIWSHVGWMVWKDYDAYETIIQRYAPKDLRRDWWMRFFHRYYPWLHLVPATILLGVGYCMGGWRIALSLFVWGMIVRLLIVLHSTWTVNSLSHLYGYQTYDTGDHSRNNWFVALITFGEGWHNNHHKFPTSVMHGHRGWELDPSYWAICAMEFFGIIRNVKRHTKKPKSSL